MVILALYFILVFGWAIFVIVLKCRKARAKRLAEQEEATLQQQQQEQQQQQQPVHVIQIGNNVYDIIPITNQNYDQIYCNGPHNRPNNNHLHHHHNCVTNPAFIMDHEGGIYPAGNNTVLEADPPPYEEVIRWPNNFPKVADAMAQTTGTPVATATATTTRTNAIAQPNVITNTRQTTIATNT